MGQATPKISFVIVNFQSADYLKKCVSSLWTRKGDFPIEIIIVNNDNSNLGADFFEYPVKILNAKRNGGFGSGSNLGAKEASSEILCFINPDTELASDNLRSVLDEFENNETVGAIGPDIIDEKGETRKSTSGEEITLGRLISHNLGIKNEGNKHSEHLPSETDWVSGACLFIRRELFLKIEGFDEKFFAYYEDVDLCKRIKNEGYKILRLPEIKILHWEGKSFTDRGRQKKIYYESQKEYFRKHHGAPKAMTVDILRKLSHR